MAGFFNPVHLKILKIVFKKNRGFAQKKAKKAKKKAQTTKLQRPGDSKTEEAVRNICVVPDAIARTQELRIDVPRAAPNHPAHTIATLFF